MLGTPSIRRYLLLQVTIRRCGQSAGKTGKSMLCELMHSRDLTESSETTRQTANLVKMSGRYSPNYVATRRAVHESGCRLNFSPVMAMML